MRPDPAPPDGARLEDEAVRRVEAWLLHDRRRRTVHASGGLAEAIEEAGGGRFEYAYDRRGDLVRIIEANGRCTTFEYDDSRCLTRVAHPDGTSTDHAYEDDRLVRIEDRGVKRRFRYDDAGRVTRIQRGDAGASVYRYDVHGRVTEARTPAVSTVQSYDPDGRIAAIRQSHGGVAIELRLEYDDAGRLAKLWLPGSTRPVRYVWDEMGRPHTVALGERTLASFEYSDERKRSCVRFGNGIVEETDTDPVDCRPAERRIQRDGESLFERAYGYGSEGQLVSDGASRYEYDALDRLVEVEEVLTGQRWRYEYDVQDNRVEADEPGGSHRYRHDADNRLVEVETMSGGSLRIAYDRFGRPIRKDDPAGRWTYRYDDAGQLLEVRRRGNVVARFVYDHKGRLVAMRSAARSERYLYGPDDQLFAVTDEYGAPLRLYVRSPLGLLAEVHGSVDDGTIGFHHQDHQGVRHLVTDEGGQVVASWEYDPFGAPSGPACGFLPMFGGRVWNPEIGMYNFGARWYDPRLGRFLTPDTYTGRPDDERLVHPCRSAGTQGAARSQILGDWLKQPRVRNLYAFCGNDPVGRIDPNGHWSFGWTLLSILGAIWTLPNTLIGLFLEITCLIGEVLRWLAWLISFGHVTWETPGFDVAASGRLNAFALVFKGGWLGSIPGLLGITFGNVFFVHGKWDQHPDYSGPGVVYPPAYKGKVSIPKKDSLYEHELRHTNQYGWFGPFFHLGLPVFGVYVWDVILHGYRNAWTERDAREHAEDADSEIGPAPAPGPTPAPGPAPTPDPAPASVPSAQLYGGYDLEFGDRDTGSRYGGAARSAARGERLPGPSETPYVRQLQQDLQTLGFRIVGNDDGAFGRRVSWAVREFQAYAKMEHVAYERVPGPNVATRYADRLTQVANSPASRYTGPVSGVVNAATRAAIRHWLALRWRCPVIIDAWNMVGGNRSTVHTENVWLYDEVTGSAPRMFARDFSRYYTLAAGRNPDDPIVVGHYVRPPGNYPGGGVSTPPRYTWTEGELLPEHLVGINLAGLNAAQRSTYKVVRAVSEQECYGFFDCLNAWDNAFVSLGPCHWTLGIFSVSNPPVAPATPVTLPTRSVSEGELCGYLAYLRQFDPDAFREAFEFFGVRVHEDWMHNGVANGHDLFDTSQRKYLGRVAVQQEDGSYAPLPLTKGDWDHFSTWHWYYRFLMAGRTIEGFRLRMWHMARIRLRDIRDTPWGPGVPNVPDGTGGTRPATIGDVYTSERAMGLILRWHVRFPAHVISGGRAGQRLRRSFAHAAIPQAAGDPTAWINAHEAALVNGIMTEVNNVNNQELANTMNGVRNWPTWAAGGNSNPRGYTLDPTIGNLAVTRNSFQFDGADLPPSP